MDLWAILGLGVSISFLTAMLTTWPDLDKKDKITGVSITVFCGIMSYIFFI